MEAVCPECQVRYEVSEELLAQGTSIGCPTCQVPLDLTQPDAQTDAQPDGGQEESMSSSADQPQADESAGATTSDTQETQPPKAGWDADQLLWGNKEGSAEQTTAVVEEEAEAWGTVPTWGEPAQDTQPAEPTNDQAPSQAATPDSQTEDPAPQSTDPTGSENRQAEGKDTAPQPAEPTDLQAETATSQTEADVSDNQNAQTDQAAQAELAQPPATPGAATTPDSEPAPEFVQPQVASLSQSLSDDNPEPDSQVDSQQTDWAAAAAKWAESGFSTDNMPDFVKGREAEAQPDSSQPQPTSVEAISNVAAPPTQQPLLPPQDSTPREEVSQAVRGKSITPPPLPSVGNANLPSPTNTPPPLDRSHASYNLQGSGEGQQEPWHQEEQPQPEQPADSVEPIVLSGPETSVAPETPVAPEASDQEIQAAAFAPKTSMLTKMLAMLATVGVIGIGVWLAHHFSEGKWFAFGSNPTSEAQDKSSAVPTPATAVPKPRPEPAKVKKESDKPSKPTADQPPPARATKAEKTADTNKKTKSAKVAKNVGKQRRSTKRQRELALLHYKKGNQAIRKKNFKEAINMFRKALKADRTLAQAHRGLGISYAQLRQNKRACREYRKYLDMLNPDSPEVEALRKILKGCK